MRIALLQMTSGIDPVVNSATMVAAVAEAASGGATMLFTPEMSGLIDRDRERAQASVRYEDDDLVLAAVCEADVTRGGMPAMRRPKIVQMP